MNIRSALNAIDRAGLILVFPIANKKEPHSLWQHFYPKSKMRWEWDDNGDDRVAQLWHLREQLSRSGKVVYAKWYQGRATFFSRDAFTLCLALLNGGSPSDAPLSPAARLVLDRLNDDSPTSLKTIKRDLKPQGLDGRLIEKALKELWSRLLIVGHGEIDDGAFPSLAIGATEAMLEPLWKRAHKGSLEKWSAEAERAVPAETAFGRALRKLARALPKAKALPATPPARKAARGGQIRYEDLVKRGAG